MGKEVFVLDFGEVFINEDTDPVASSISGFGGSQDQIWIPRFGKKKEQGVNVAFVLGWSSVNSTRTLVSRDNASLAKNLWPFIPDLEETKDLSFKAPTRTISIQVSYSGQTSFTIPDLFYGKVELMVNELLYDKRAFLINGTTLTWKGKFFLSVEDTVTLLTYW